MTYLLGRGVEGFWSKLEYLNERSDALYLILKCRQDHGLRSHLLMFHGFALAMEEQIWLGS